MDVDARVHKRYVSALGFHWLTRCYDPLLRATLKEGKFKRLLIQQRTTVGKARRR